MAKDETISRRQIITSSMAVGITAAGIAGLVGSPKAFAMVEKAGTKNDITILNAALDLEHQAIWAYTAAGSKLSSTPVGKTILTLALRNQADHKKHRDILVATIKKLGGEPSAAKDSYDVTPYVNAGEGNLDSDANIAKLALALEVDAALAYGDAFAKLKGAGLIAAAATIAPDEAAHATAIRAVFHTLDASIEYVASAFLSPDTRNDWILKV